MFRARRRNSSPRRASSSSSSVAAPKRPRPIGHAALSGTTPSRSRPFDFAESRLLAEIYAQALESTGLDVVRAFGLGPREFVAPALAQGLVELVPEYSGTALQFLSLDAEPPPADPQATHAALRRVANARGITVLASGSGPDANTFVVTRETAERRRLRRISDLAGVDAELTFGGPPECPTRPAVPGGPRGRLRLGVQGVREARHGRAGHPPGARATVTIDVALLFTTDPAIGGRDLVELEDDRDLQPAENVTPLVRDEVVERWGDDPRRMSSTPCRAT